jgi:hypothetical protein
MRFVAEPISQHRLSRFHCWVMLWLAWVAAFLEAAGASAPVSKQAQTIGHTWLDSIERIIVSIVMLRAVRHIRRVLPRKGVAPHRRNDSSLHRAVIGSAMRRALRSSDIRKRIEALTQNLDGLVARLLKRLPCGLTRRRPIIACPEAREREAPSVECAPALAVDTS